MRKTPIIHNLHENWKLNEFWEILNKNAVLGPDFEPNTLKMIKMIFLSFAENQVRPRGGGGMLRKEGPFSILNSVNDSRGTRKCQSNQTKLGHKKIYWCASPWAYTPRGLYTEYILLFWKWWAYTPRGLHYFFL